MFSRTTIESSTTRPTEMVRAPSVSMFRERPPAHMERSATTSDSGMDTAVTMVERKENRNSRMTRIAKTSPNAPSVVSPSMDRSTKGAWSKTTVSSVPSPSARSSSGSRSCTARETSTVLPSGVRVTVIPRLSEPLVRVREVAASSVSVISATSPSRTGVPAPGAS